MTARNHREHLDEDAILRCLVDASDLSDEERAHVETCPVCRKELDALGEALARLGEEARAYAPPAPVPAVGSGRVPEKTRGSAWSLRHMRVWAGSLAAATAALFMLWLFPWGGPTGPSHPVSPAGEEQAGLSAPLEGVLEPPPLPSIVRLIAEEPVGFENGFLEFVAPFALEGEAALKMWKGRWA